MGLRSVLILISLLCAVAALADPPNLVVNAGFEELDAANFPRDWQPTYWSNPKGKMESATEAHSGARSLKITGLPREQITDVGKSNNHLTGQDLGDRLVGPARLTLRVWIKTSGTGTGYCSVITKDKNGKNLQYLSSGKITREADWVELVWPFQTDAQTQSAILYLRNSGEGSVWFDDVSVVGSGDMLQNDLARVLVDPLLGGRICSYMLKPGDRDLTVWHGMQPGGLAAEIVPAEDYPGLMRDAPCTITEIEPHRHVLVVHDEAGGAAAGLRVERELRLLDNAVSVEVLLRVRNVSAEAKPLNLRAQQCLPPGTGLFSWPTRDHVRILQPPAHLLKASLEIADLREGWLASSDPGAGSGVAMLFDRAQVSRALIYMSSQVRTLEWYYRPVTLPPNGVWETRYLIAPLATGAPVVGMAADVALALTPARVPADRDQTLSLMPLRGQRSAEVKLDAKVGGKTQALSRTVQFQPGVAAEIKLPWPGKQLQQLRVTSGAAPAVTLAAATINDKPIHNFAPPTEQPPFPALAGFFPYGEYFRGLIVPEAGTIQQATERQLRTYRRAYLNSYTVREDMCLSPLKAGQEPWLCEMVRRYHVRLIPKNDLLRVFEYTAGGGINREKAAPQGTREAMLERIAKSGFDLPLRKAFAEKYGDTVLGYDLSDEPGSEYIPAYVQLQALMREADPAHPVLAILNLERTEYLPYMPVYYGDEYPIGIRGREPWRVAEIVRFCSQKTTAPVWVMLQAFGGREGYSWILPNAPETRLTIWLTVANGGKGITWHGSQSPPCWRYNQHYFDSLCDSWGLETPGWVALRDAGRQVTAIGPSLLQTDYVAEHPFTVETEPVDFGPGKYQGPAVTLGVLKQRAGDGFFIVAANNDIEKERAATLQVDGVKAGAGAQLCDLQDLKSLGSAATARPKFTLIPGDGRVFYCGTPASCASVLSAIHRAHYDNERVIYDMDAGTATANQVDIAAASSLAREAAAAYERRDYTTAHTRLTAAQVKLAEAIAAAHPLSDVLGQLREALSALSAVATVYKDNFRVLVPVELQKATPYGPAFVNRQDPTLQQFVDQTAEAFCQRMLLEDQVVAGQAAAAAEPAAKLLAQAKRLQAEAIPYVQAKATK